MDILNRQFGLIIAYLLPGFIALAGIAPLVPTVAGWLRAGQTANLGAPIYALLAATAAGMIVSCFRWLIVDRIHLLAGVPGPVFNAQALEEQPGAFNYLVESHYRYYQFYANTLVALTWTYSICRILHPSPLLGIGTDVGMFFVAVALFAGSRDSLSKYRVRSKQLVGLTTVNFSNGELMTNGIDHNQGNESHSPKPTAAPKKPKPKAPSKPEASSHANAEHKH
jgi:hypothetical protein